MKKILLVAGILSLSSIPVQIVQAQVINADVVKPAAQYTEAEIKAMGEGVAFPYDLFDKVLRKYVDDKGNVFYAKVKGDNDLELFVRAVAIADLKKFPKWMTEADPDDPQSKEVVDRRPELTFWINAYNALFVKAIADAYPINSVNEIRDLTTAKTRVVAGKKYSFDEMRRIIADIDPRAVFALTDGTKDGPRLLPLAYRFFGLNERLTAVAQGYVNDPAHVKIPERNMEAYGSVEVSPWLQGADPYLGKPKSSRRKYEGIRAALAGYTSRTSDRNFFATSDPVIKFSKSNGELNEQLSTD